MHLNTSLSQGQAAFALMLEKAPYLQPLWNLEKQEYIPEIFENFLGTASHGQAIMARFFLSVWTHRNDFGFNVIDAAAILDDDQKQIIVSWVLDPFWP